MSNVDELGDRMKLYEGQEADRRFLPLLPICARLDGRSFSNFTKGLSRPYDENFSAVMRDLTYYLVGETCACIGYTQSDEISLVFYSPDVKSQVFFDGRIQKMTSVLASMASVRFSKLIATLLPQKAHIDAQFDCRVWQLPSLEEAANVLVWREIDATKNSVQMAAREYYSDKQLFGKGRADQMEMLFQKGVNWNNYPDFFKRGSYFQRRRTARKFTAAEIEHLPQKHQARTNPDLVVERAEVRALDMPPITRVVNRVGVIFEGQDPQSANASFK